MNDDSLILDGILPYSAVLKMPSMGYNPLVVQGTKHIAGSNSARVALQPGVCTVQVSTTWDGEFNLGWGDGSNYRNVHNFPAGSGGGVAQVPVVETWEFVYIASQRSIPAGTVFGLVITPIPAQNAGK